jgi:hypothetical protein
LLEAPGDVGLQEYRGDAELEDARSFLDGETADVDEEHEHSISIGELEERLVDPLLAPERVGSGATAGSAIALRLHA